MYPSCGHPMYVRDLAVQSVQSSNLPKRRRIGPATPRQVSSVLECLHHLSIFPYQVVVFRFSLEVNPVSCCQGIKRRTIIAGNERRNTPYIASTHVMFGPARIPASLDIPLQPRAVIIDIDCCRRGILMGALQRTPAHLPGYH
jgi:hypothetical protein